MRRLLMTSVLLVLPRLGMADGVDRTMLNRISDEGLNHSALPQTAEYLMDRIGGRMTNSPQMRMAEKWTQEQFRHWTVGCFTAKATATALARRLRTPVQRKPEETNPFSYEDEEE